MKPIWLLDVDGVINATSGATPYSPGHWATWQAQVCNGYRIQWAPPLIDRVQGLVDEGLVEIRWLTTWWNDIHHLPWAIWHAFPVANDPEDYTERTIGWWKLPVAQRLHEPGRKMVWTDDDLMFSPPAIEWVEAVQPDVLAIAPRSHLGLTPAHLDDIEGFLRGR